MRWGFGRRLFFNVYAAKAEEMITLGVRSEEPEEEVTRQVSAVFGSLEDVLER